MPAPHTLVIVVRSFRLAVPVVGRTAGCACNVQSAIRINVEGACEVPRPSHPPTHALNEPGRREPRGADILSALRAPASRLSAPTQGASRRSGLEVRSPLP